MDTNELFIDFDKLPEKLSQDEFNDLLKQARNGVSEARDKIIIHSIRLVLYEIRKKFYKVNYDKKDLVSIGILGLINAIDNFDLSKKVRFSTYAMVCIDNEILIFLRKLKKYNSVKSLDEFTIHKKDGSITNLKREIFYYDKDLINEMEINDINKVIRKFVINLPDIDKKAMMLYFGFYNNKVYSQKKIATILNVSQPTVSRIITKNVKKISAILESRNLIELQSKQYKTKQMIKKF